MNNKRLITEYFQLYFISNNTITEYNTNTLYLSPTACLPYHERLRGFDSSFSLKIKYINMSVVVSTCSKSSLPAERGVIQSIYLEAQQRLAYSQAWVKADTPQKDSYRSEQGCQMFEGEVPWKVQLMSSAFLPLQPLIHCSRSRRET